MAPVDPGVHSGWRERAAAANKQAAGRPDARSPLPKGSNEAVRKESEECPDDHPETSLAVVCDLGDKRSDQERSEHDREPGQRPRYAPRVRPLSHGMSLGDTAVSL
jgi:hypothetical protein